MWDGHRRVRLAKRSILHFSLRFLTHSLFAIRPFDDSAESNRSNCGTTRSCGSRQDRLDSRRTASRRREWCSDCGTERGGSRSRMLRRMYRPLLLQYSRWPSASFPNCVRNVIKIQRSTATPARPIAWINAAPCPAVETRPRPIPRAFDVTVLHRIVMHVIEMLLEIVVIFQRVLPEFRLPDAPTALAAASRGLRLLATATLQPVFRKLLLDPAATFGIRIVAGGK